MYLGQCCAECQNPNTRDNQQLGFFQFIIPAITAIASYKAQKSGAKASIKSQERIAAAQLQAQKEADDRAFKLAQEQMAFDAARAAQMQRAQSLVPGSFSTGTGGGGFSPWVLGLSVATPLVVYALTRMGNKKGR